MANVFPTPADALKKSFSFPRRAWISSSLILASKRSGSGRLSVIELSPFGICQTVADPIAASERAADLNDQNRFVQVALVTVCRRQAARRRTEELVVIRTSTG